MGRADDERRPAPSIEAVGPSVLSSGVQLSPSDDFQARAVDLVNVVEADQGAGDEHEEGELTGRVQGRTLVPDSQNELGQVPSDVEVVSGHAGTEPHHDCSFARREPERADPSALANGREPFALEGAPTPACWSMRVTGAVVTRRTGDSSFEVISNSYRLQRIRPLEATRRIRMVAPALIDIAHPKSSGTSLRITRVLP